jgi:hypothetical protein
MSDEKLNPSTVLPDEQVKPKRHERRLAERNAKKKGKTENKRLSLAREMFKVDKADWLRKLPKHLGEELQKRYEEKLEYSKLHKFLVRMCSATPTEDAFMKQVFIVDKTFLGPYKHLKVNEILDSMGYNSEEFEMDGKQYIQCTLRPDEEEEEVVVNSPSL